MKTFLKNIPSYPLPFAVWNLLKNQFYQKVELSGYFQQKKCKTGISRRVPENLQLFLSFLKISRNLIVFGKIPDGEGRGIARNILKKNIFYFQNSSKTGNKVGTV